MGEGVSSRAHEGGHVQNINGTQLSMIELHKSRDNKRETNHRYDSDDGRYKTGIGMAYNINSLMRLTTVSTVEYDTLM